MPATGVRPPARILVAVRAMAPVAGRPPNSADTVLATPCATSSMFERWRPPVMPSATTADSSDSTPARKAMVNALGSSSRVRSNGMCGNWKLGSAEGRPPNLLPMVSAGSAKAVHTSVHSSSAIRNPGHAGRQRRSPMIANSPSSVSATAAGWVVAMCFAYAAQRGMNSAGTWPICSPSASLI